MNKIKKTIFSAMIFLSLAIIAGCTTSRITPQQDTPWYTGSNTIILEEIEEYFESHFFQPVFNSDEPLLWKNVTTLIRDGIPVYYGKCRQGNKEYTYMFAAKKKENRNIKVQLLYLAREDVSMLPGLRLFYDVITMAGAGPGHPVFEEVPNFHVLIEPFEFDTGSRDEYTQNWVFFNPMKQVTIPVNFKSDGEGGMYFTMPR